MPHIYDPPKIDKTITVNDVKKGFKIWRESTSIFSSGRKLPLYKIWLHEHQDDEILPGHQFFHIITDIIKISQLLQ